MLIEFHRNMLADRVRNEAFVQALKKIIKPGESTVADLGSGTGFLAFVANQLGAKQCYLYEYSGAIKLSQKIAQKNHIRRCHFIHGHSAQVENPVPVDVIISETLGNYAYEEHIIENLQDAKRFLKPNGIMIPAGINQFVAPVINKRFWDELCVWDDVGYGLDLSLAKAMSLNNLYVRTFSAADLLWPEQAKCWDKVDFSRTNASVRKGKAHWTVSDDCSVYGFALWWTCTLVPGITLSTNPLSPGTHWEQLYLPVQEPLSVAPGDILEIDIHSDSRYEVGVNVRWNINVHRDKQELIKQQLDMRKGYLEES